MLLENLDEIPSLKDDDIMYSGYFINKNQEELQNWIGKQFSSSSDIKSFKKKKTVQSILEKFSKYFESLLEEKYSFQFFVTENESLFFPLHKAQLDIIKKYHKKDEFLCEDGYDWKDFYFNDKFISAYEVDKEALQHYYFTKTKFEERDRVIQYFMRDYLLKFPAYFFIENLKSKLLEKLTPQIPLQNGKNKHEQLINTKEEFDLQKNIKKLELIFNELEKNSDKFVFGNDIIKAIQNYEIKEIYCFEEFKSKLESKLPRELFNFNWYVFPKNDSKLNDYRGILGVKYF